MRIKAIAALCVSVSLLVTGASAWFCECISPGPPEEHIEKADKIFLGRIVSAHYLEQAFDHDAVWDDVSLAKIEVTGAIKGTDVGAVLEVYFPIGSDCDTYPEVGRSDIFFLFDMEDGLFFIQCWQPSRRQLADAAYFRILSKMADINAREVLELNRSFFSD